MSKLDPGNPQSFQRKDLSVNAKFPQGTRFVLFGAGSVNLRAVRKTEADMGHWADDARRVILEVHRGLPEAATLADRIAAVDAAYPFGQRAYSPYKTWLKARREYLCRYGYQPKGKPLVESPMERMMRRGSSAPLPSRAGGV